MLPGRLRRMPSCVPPLPGSGQLPGRRCTARECPRGSRQYPLLNPDGSVPQVGREPERLVCVFYYQEKMEQGQVTSVMRSNITRPITGNRVRTPCVAGAGSRSRTRASEEADDCLMGSGPLPSLQWRDVWDTVSERRSRRLETPSLSKMRERQFFNVRWPIPVRCEISRLVRP